MKNQICPWGEENEQLSHGLSNHQTKSQIIKRKSPYHIITKSFQTSKINFKQNQKIQLKFKNIRDQIIKQCDRLTESFRPLTSKIIKALSPKSITKCPSRIQIQYKSQTKIKKTSYGSKIRIKTPPKKQLYPKYKYNDDEIFINQKINVLLPNKKSIQTSLQEHK